MRRVVSLVVLAVVIGLLVGAVGAQLIDAAVVPPPDRKTLKQLVVTLEEVRAALEKQDWRPKAPPEPLPVEPSGSITAAAIFQFADDTDLLLFAILYWFERQVQAEEFYAQPIAFNVEGNAEKPDFQGLSELLCKELVLGKWSEDKCVESKGADEARLVEDPVSRNPVLQFREGTFVARLRPARLSGSSTLDFPGTDLIKVAKTQLDILKCFLETGQRAQLKEGKLICPK